MISVRKLFLLLVLLLFPQFCFADTGKYPLYSQSTGSGSIWIPNTTFINGERVLQINKKLFIPTYSGIAVYENVSGAFRVIPLSVEDSLVSSLETVKGKIWIVTRREGVFVLDPDTEKITEQFLVHKSTGLNVNANLYSVSYPNSGLIWFSSYLGLNAYDISKDVWISLIDQFEKNGIGKPSSQHRILIDNDAVWISGGAHVGSTGAILKCSLNAAACASFSQKLISEMKRDRIDPLDLFASDTYIWTIYSGGNLFDSYIAEYDKTTRQWNVYGRDKFIVPIEHIVASWPNIKVTGSFSLFWFLEHFLNSAEYQIKSASSEEKISINQVMGNVRKGLTILTQLDGMTDFRLCAGLWRFGIGTCNERVIAHGKDREILYATKTPIKFNAILACQNDSALLTTSSGMGVVDFKSADIKWVAAPKNFGTDYIDILTAEAPNGVYIKRTWEEGDSDIPPDYSLFDFKSATLSKLSASPATAAWHSLRKSPLTECPLSDGRRAVLSKTGIYIR